MEVINSNRAPSIEGLQLLNGHPIDQDSLFECNNVVVFVILNGSSRIIEEHLDDLCRIMDRYYDNGVVTLVNFEHYNPMILHTASGVHTYKRLLVSYDPSSLIAQRYRAIFHENDRQKATAFIIDKAGIVQWHGGFKDDAFEATLKRIIPDKKPNFDMGLEGGYVNCHDQQPGAHTSTLL